MKGKLIVACMTVAAFATMPTVASARPHLCETSEGVCTDLVSPKTIVGTNVGITKMTTSLGTIEASEAKLVGTLTTNSSAAGSVAEITSAVFGGTGTQVSGEPAKEVTSWTGGVSITPKISAAEPWCLKAVEAEDFFEIRGGKCGESSKPTEFTLVFTNSLIGTCTYSRVTAVPGSLVTDTSGQQASGTISEKEWTKSAGGGGCFTSGKLNMTFDFETESGIALYFKS